MSYKELLGKADYDEIIDRLSVRDPDTIGVEGNDRNIIGMTDKAFINMYYYHDVIRREDIKIFGWIWRKGKHSLQMYRDDQVCLYATENGTERRKIIVKLLYLFESRELKTQQIIVEVLND